jgi:hypothetical protein
VVCAECVCGVCVCVCVYLCVSVSVYVVTSASVGFGVCVCVVSLFVTTEDSVAETDTAMTGIVRIDGGDCQDLA